MTRYRRKPVEVEAWQVGSDEPCPDWILSARIEYKGYNGQPDMWLVLCADNIGTAFNASKGDYIINDGGYYSRWPSDAFNGECGPYSDYEKAKPYYLEVYDWAFCGMEGADGYEFEMFSEICGAIGKFRKAVSE